MKDKYFPPIFNLVLTDSCLLRCDFCAKNYDEKNQKISIKKDNIRVIKNAIDKIYDLGTRIFEVTPITGDSLTVPATLLSEVFDYLDTKDGVIYFLFTSAVTQRALNKEYFDVLRRDNLYIYLSIYGTNEKDFLTTTRGTPKQYKILKENCLAFQKNVENYAIYIRSNSKHDIFFDIFFKSIDVFVERDLDNHNYSIKACNKKTDICKWQIMNNGVDTDGNLLLCSWADVNYEESFGKLSDVNLDEKYEELEKMFKETSITKNMKFCQTCDYFEKVESLESGIQDSVNTLLNDFRIKRDIY